MKNFEMRRKEYIKAAKILTPKECEQEVTVIAKALHTKQTKAFNKMLITKATNRGIA